MTSSFTRSVIALVLIVSQCVPLVTFAAEVGYEPNPNAQSSVVVDGIGTAGNGQVSVTNPTNTNTSQTSPTLDSKQSLANKGSVDRSSGAFTYTYPLQLPAGRGTLRPELELNYDSRRRNYDTYTGLGWELEIPSVKRLNKEGSDIMFDRTDFSTPDGELVKIDGVPGQYGTYGVRQGYGRYYFTADNLWQTTNKQGITYVYGKNARHRKQDANNNERATEWMLSEIRDQFGNKIVYDYTKSRNHIFPESIIYGGQGIKILFNYRDVYNANIKNDYYDQFLVIPDRVLQTISVRAEGAPILEYRFDVVSPGSINFPYVQQDDPDDWPDDPSYGNGQGNSVLNGITVKQDSAVISNEYYTYQDTKTTGRLKPGTMYQNGNYSPTFTISPYNDIFPAPFTVTNNVNSHFKMIDITGDGYMDLTYFASSNGNVYTYAVAPWDNALNKFQVDPALSFSRVGSGNPAKFADLDADGDLDRVEYNVSSGGSNKIGEHSWFQNTTTGWVQMSVNLPTQLANETGDFVLADVNRDGYLDITVSTNASTSTRFYFGSATGFTYQPDVTISGGPSFTFNSQYISFSDINNDAKLDLISGTSVYLSRNGKFVYSPGYSNSPITTDINNDGLMDSSAVPVNGNGYSYVKFNTGSDWSPELKLSSNDAGYSYYRLASVDGAHEACNLKQSAPCMTLNYYNVRQWPIDINYDGYSDLIRCTSNCIYDGGMYPGDDLYVAPLNRAGLMTTITNYYGGQTQVEYGTEVLKNTNTVGTPETQVVVKSVTYQGDVNRNTDTMKSTYTYENGMRYYNHEELGTAYAGFGRVTETDAAGVKTVYSFHQGNATNSSQGEYDDTKWKIGRAYRVEVLDNAGNPASLTTTKWNQADLGSGRYFVFAENTVSTVVSGNTPVSSAVAYTYDTAYGELVRKHDLGAVNANNDGTFTDIGDDKITTDYIYVTNGTLVRLKQETVRGHDGTILSNQRNTYDNGNLTFGLTTTSQTEVSPDVWATTSYTYNPQGMPTGITDPMGNTTTINYDMFLMYPSSVTNALGQTTNSVYDLLSGQPVYIRDPNGLESVYTYDALSRPLTMKRDGVLLWEIIYSTNFAPYTSVRQRRAMDNNVYEAQRIYPNQWGQPYQVFGTNNEVTYTYYNNRGQVYRTTIPMVSGNPADVVYGIVTTFDALSRPLSVTDARGTTITSYNGLSTTTVNAMGIPRTLVRDIRGNTVQVVEHNNGEQYTTNYTYNQRNQLTGYTDSDGNVRQFEYDYRGLRTVIGDLHVPGDATVGRIQNQYDKMGRLVKQIRMDGTQFITTYDALSRPTELRGYSANGLQLLDMVTTSYDTCTNGIGRTCGVTKTADYTNPHDDSIIAYTYDNRGQNIATDMTINGQTKTTTTTYTDAGLPSATTLPNGDVLSVVYNGNNQPHKLRVNGADFVTVTYQGSSRVQKLQFANGTKTEYGYNAQKLYELMTQVTTTPAGIVQDVEYTRDALGQITTSADYATPTVGSDTWPSKSTDYEYDDLMRLIGIDAVYNTGDTLTRDYTYGRTGNILQVVNGGSIGTPGTYDYTYADGQGNDGLVSGSTAQFLQIQQGGHGDAEQLPIDDIVSYRSEGSSSWSGGGQVGVAIVPTHDPILSRMMDYIVPTAYAQVDPISADDLNIRQQNANQPTVPLPTDTPVTDGGEYIDPNLPGGENQQTPTDTDTESGDDDSGNGGSGGGSSYGYMPPPPYDPLLPGTIGNPNLGNGNPPPLPLPGAVNGQSLLDILQTLSGNLWHIFVVAGGVLLEPFGIQNPDGSTVLLRSDRIGRAKILPGDLVVHIEYGTTDTVPTVVLAPTSRILSRYWVANKTATGFDIIIDQTQDTDATFDWYAYAIPDQQVPVYVSDGTVINPPGSGNGGTTPDVPVVPTDNTVPPTTTLVNEYANPHAVISTQLSALSSQNLVYDLNGNVIQLSDGSTSSPQAPTNIWSYTYDMYDNMLSATLTDSTGTQLSQTLFSYDGLGNRISKSTVIPGQAGTQVTYYWSDSYETDSDGSTRVLVNFANQHLATLSSQLSAPSSVMYYHNDPLGTSQVITNTDGDILSITDSLPYGDVVNQQTTPSTSSGQATDYFALHERDDETGLTYMQARYYNDGIKRFYSLDPASLHAPEKFINDPQQLNLYSYARNNPVQYNDPTGQCIDGFTTAACVYAIGAAAVAAAPAIQAYLQEESMWLAMDVNDLTESWNSSGATSLSRLGAVGLFAASTIGPGGGYGRADDIARSLMRSDSVVQHGLQWSSTRNLSSVDNLVGHFTKHAHEFGFETPQQMYDSAMDIVNGVDQKTIFSLNGGRDIYQASTNTLVGLNSKGEISTMHKLTDPKKLERITNQVNQLKKTNTTISPVSSKKKNK